MKEQTTQVIIKNSLKVIGKFTLIHSDGTEEIIEGKRSFCRCGLSSAMPFCDNTHRSNMEWVKKISNKQEKDMEFKNATTQALDHSGRSESPTSN